MDDDEVTMGLKELENLPDDLFLEDVGKSVWASRSKRRPGYGRGGRRGYPRKGGRGGRKAREDEDRDAWSDEHPGDLSFEEEADAEWRREDGPYRKDKERGEFRRVMMKRSKEDPEDDFEGKPRGAFDVDRRRRSRERPWDYGQKGGADPEEGDDYFNPRYALSRKRRSGRISSANDDSCSPSVLERQHRHGSKELGLESPVKKRERSLSPGRYSGRGRWERSSSPQSLCRSDRGQSVSPPGGSRHQGGGRSSRNRRSGNHEWSVSPPPQRHPRKQPAARYRSPPEGRQWSGGPPLGGHRPSAQPLGHYPVPVPGTQAPQGGYDMPPPSMYPESGYAAPSSNYGGQTTSGYHGDYQQQYSYDGYYQQPPAYTSEYVAPPAQTSWQQQQQQDGYGRDVGQHVPQGNLAENSAVAAAAHQKADNAKKEAAIQNELIQQKQTLALQREEYMKKSASITRELSLLKDQEKELLHDDSRDSKRILHENHKLQLEIQNKLKAINNVIDMLTGIIGDSKAPDKSKAGDKAKKADITDELSFGDEARMSPLTAGAGSGDGQRQYNLVYYDPEMHWCRVCDIFPRTAKEYLNHLHGDEHKQIILEKKLTDLPWHKSKADDVAPFVEGLPSKRTPIRGLQFFVSATAWYCKLCDAWIGDLHCASVHLKSKAHSEKYTEFTHQNPHWETDWLADREKAYEEKRLITSGAGRKSSKKSKDRKHRSHSKDSHSSSGSSSSGSSSSSSSSSSSEEAEGDRARSIHVAMRNKVKQQQQVAPPHPPPPPTGAPPPPPEVEVPRSKWDSPPSAKDEPHEEKVAKEWVTVEQRQPQDRSKTKRGGEDRERIREQERERDREREERERDREREERERDREREEREREREGRERERNYERGGRKDRGRKRSESPKSRRERDRERERERGRERRRGSPAAAASSPRRGRGANDADSEAETKFEKRFSESAKMKKAKKQQPQAPGAAATSAGAAPKSKLPFIGRMPLLKNIARKKGEAAAAAAARPDDAPRGPEDMDIDDDVSGGETIAENVAVAPPPEAGEAPAAPARQLPPPPPPYRAEAPRPPEGPGLHKDFQEALDILFPGEERPREEAAPVAWGHPYVGAWAPPPAVMYAPPGVMNGPPPSSQAPLGSRAAASAAPVSEEDLAMLGIDAGDMAAQTF